MRIIGGALGGRRLTSVGRGAPGAHLRPTTDRVRESIFSILTHRIELEDVRVLDLFAGTGALGLEALSRGAKEVTFVENGRTSLKLLQQNIELLEVGERSRVLRLDATRLDSSLAEAYDVVFLDPPYGKGLGERALAAALSQGWFGAGAVAVWEEAEIKPAPQGFSRLLERRYGDSAIMLLAANG